MVKRYGSNGFEPGVIEVECGDLVHYDDYKALLAENERLKAERVDLKQFRNAVMFHLSDAEQSSEVEEGERLLALIDSHKGE